jgi:hypothetical protein
MSASTICHGCGLPLHVPEDYARSKMRCPECGVMCEVPPPEARKPVERKAAGRAAPARKRPRERRRPDPAPEPPIPAAPPPPEPADDPDDGLPYRMAAGAMQKCPECGKELPANAATCPACAAKDRAVEKPPKVYAPVEYHWEAGWSLHKRVIAFIACQAVVLPGLVYTVAQTGEWWGSFTIWFFFTAVLAFVAGTYDRVDLERSRRGRVKLSKHWRVLFFPGRTTRYDVLEFEGIRTGMARDVDFSDWIIMFLFLPAGVFPGVLWWYYFIHKDQYTVFLTKEHGYAAETLYQGLSQEHAQEVAHTVSEVAQLPFASA